ncbi:MAG: efflux RND transporter permease subunit, partial [Elusimicrobiaceae bacterium]|nr:efflux RND transporter permease subunit [Elusimicrobiaceae bacterium]
MLNAIVSFSVRHRLAVLCAALAAAGWGAIALKALPVDAFPDVTNVQVEIVATAQGKSPFEIEKFIAYPLENALRGIPGL